MQTTPVERKQKTPSRTHSHQVIDYLNPHNIKVVEQDLYHGLHNKRYSSQIDVDVLTHLALGLELCTMYGYKAKVKAYWACHDLHEAYTLDIPQGMKEVLPEYKQYIEDPWEQYLHEQMGLAWPADEDTVKKVKHVDMRCLAVETWTRGWGDWEPLQEAANRWGGFPNDREIAVGRQQILYGTDEVRFFNIMKAIKNYTGE